MTAAGKTGPSASNLIWGKLFAAPGHQPGLETAKWLALVLMLLDHANLLLLNSSQPWMHSLGRMALPLFCFCFGAGLARGFHPQKTVFKLIAFGAAAQIAWIVCGQGNAPPLNIMLLMGATAWLISRPRSLVAWCLAAGIGFFAEGTYIAMGLIAASFHIEKSASKWAAGAMFLSAALIAGLNGQAIAAAVLPIYLAARYANLGPAWRSPKFFYYFYPSHIAFLGFAGSFIR